MSIILSDRGDEREVIDDERADWVNRVLVALGVDESLLLDESVDHRMILASMNLEVWHITGGMVEIYRDDKVVAQWNEPKLTMIKEPSGKLYYEIKLNEWALPFQMQRKGE